MSETIHEAYTRRELERLAKDIQQLRCMIQELLELAKAPKEKA